MKSKKFMTYRQFRNRKKGVTLDPCLDWTFKSLFTMNTPESKSALKSFLEAVLCRRVSNIVLHLNELPVEAEGEKQPEFDITCILDEREGVNIEMQGVNCQNSYDKRAEYNAAHLMNHFISKGSEWKDVPKCFQISVLNFIYDDSSRKAVSHYTMKTADGRELSSRLNVYFLELPKLKNIRDTNVKRLTRAERWIKFFLYANKKEGRNLIKKLSELEEGIMQAKRVLDFLSEDELNWQREWAEIKRVNDELTMLGASRREGIKEGIKQGIEQGIKQGLTQGLEQGLEQGKLESAMNLYQNGVSFDVIEKCTGITKEQILQKQNKAD